MLLRLYLYIKHINLFQSIHLHRVINITKNFAVFCLKHAYHGIPIMRRPATLIIGNDLKIEVYFLRFRDWGFAPNTQFSIALPTYTLLLQWRVDIASYQQSLLGSSLCRKYPLISISHRFILCELHIIQLHNIARLLKYSLALRNPIVFAWTQRLPFFIRFIVSDWICRVKLSVVQNLRNLQNVQWASWLPNWDMSTWRQLLAAPFTNID